MSDLFSFAAPLRNNHKNSYTAHDIEVLEGLEPVRKRPGMYIGGIDEHSMHHLFTEVLDNSMDEVVAGYASVITIEMHDDHSITISDNGRGIPVDDHPKFPGKSALEVILTTLHSGGKFSNNIYKTAGGLHGVGISVVNALSDNLTVKIYRDGSLFTQNYSKGVALGPIASASAPKKKQGTIINFHPDPEIFGQNSCLKAERIYELARAKAYLHKGVQIEWKCDGSLLKGDKIPNNTVIHFPGGLKDYLYSKVNEENVVSGLVFADSVIVDDEGFKIEWALAFNNKFDNFLQSYCNTIVTPLGGTHEQGFRAGLIKSIKSYGTSVGNKKASNIIIEDIVDSAFIILSVFIQDPVFQGQTKEKLVNTGISRIIENIVKDHFDHFLSGNKSAANEILEFIINNAEIRLARRSEKAILRKTFTQKLRLPGKLVDCSNEDKAGTELFIVEGDSAGGSAKQARDRKTQAILPIRGKILNIASSSADKTAQSQAIKDLEIALTSGTNNNDLKNLRYDKVIIMTDADVDGAHIAALLMTFFYLRMPHLIMAGHLYIARAPLYRITQGDKTYYAVDDKEKELLTKKLLTKSKAKIDVGRFKGLGEMNAVQLKETTMDPNTRSLLKVTIENLDDISKIVNNLMGKNPEKRFAFIQAEAFSKMDEIINNLDI
jgi:topoisomerase IV subunit B